MVNVFPLSGTETRSVVRLDRTLVAMRTERSGCQNRTLYTDVKKMEFGPVVCGTLSEKCSLQSVTRRVVAIPYRRFGTAYRFRFQGSRSGKELSLLAV